jgi:hypothetical protein
LQRRRRNHDFHELGSFFLDEPSCSAVQCLCRRQFCLKKMSVDYYEKVLESQLSMLRDPGTISDEQISIIMLEIQETKKKLTNLKKAHVHDGVKIVSRENFYLSIYLSI